MIRDIIIGFAIVGLMLGTSRAATTNTYRGVLINDAGDTRPAQSIATPGQVQTATAASAEAVEAASGLYEIATQAKLTADAAFSRTCVLKTNFVVTSTVYVMSIGGVPYDPSNQVITVHSIDTAGTNVQIVATVRQEPLVVPVLDWRQSLNGGAWSNITATVQEVDVPDGVTNAAAAYQFSLPKPNNTSAFFRVVDNSTGASGSGLWWLVFGGIFVDGNKGWTGAITNNVGAVFPVKGGIVVEPTPL